MPSINEFFPSKYISANDLMENGTTPREWNVTIRNLEWGDMGDGKRKPVLTFTNAEKPLVLNVTNKNTIVDAFGNDYANWAGKVVTLYPERTQFKGETTLGVRIKVQSGAPIKHAPPSPQGSPQQFSPEPQAQAPAPAFPQADQQIDAENIPF
jgi:hypothetical protein|tara:strand:+ start:980 stop:1438 length:459 start_codon:yes stop_codon:yes gene_type:complete